MADGLVDMPCLGRPFRLGMLYDCRSDKLVPGMTLWDTEVLHKARIEEPQPGSNFELVAEDTYENKASHLGIDASLKLSLMGGLVKVSGAASYLDDRKSSKRVARVSLQYHSTSKFEQLGMDQLGQIQHPQAFERNIATHVVTGVLYGAEAFLVFDRSVRNEESFQDVHGKMKGLIKDLPGILDVSGNADLSFQDADRNETDKFHCKFYGDFLLQENPSTFQDAVKIYQQLPKLLGGKGAPKSVPKKVWLYPLCQLDSRAQQIVREISVGLVNDVQKLLEQIHELEMESNDIGASIVHQQFKGIREQMYKFRSNISGHRSNLVKRFSVLLPKIRGDGAEEAELADLMRESDSSPFSPIQLSSWLKGKEKEEQLLASYLSKLEEARFEFIPENSLDALLIDFDRVICFAFKLGGENDPYLEVLSNYLHVSQIPVATGDSKPWHEDREVKQRMRAQLTIFKEFAEANKGEEGIKFVVTDVSLASFTSKNGASIMLYNGEIPVEFEPPSQPGTPHATAVFQDRVTLEWSKPARGSHCIKGYIVLCHSTTDPGDQWMTNKIGGSKVSATLSGLSPESTYYFKVRAECEAGFSPESGISAPVTTKSSPDTRLAVVVKKSLEYSILISNSTEPHIYQLLTEVELTDSKKRIAKLFIGKPDPRAPAPERVLMVVGATGAGKSTLINGIANYILGVKWEDKFRFKLITDEGKKSQAESQTTWITAYTFHLKDSSRVPFTLTVIDTPGFGDTRGIERDRQIAEQIKHFFSIVGKSGIDRLHGLGFVAQASLARLTPSQQYIFDSILSIYGKDIADNIFMMVTFADNQKPALLDAIAAAKIPSKGGIFKFNNSALYAKGEADGFDEMFWKLGVKSFGDFFSDFGRVQARSLTLTKEVLKEREHLENAVQGLHPQIQAGLSKMEQLRQQTEVVRRNKALIEQNKDFNYKVTVPKSRRIKTKPRQYVTNCLECNFTCHLDCGISNSEDKDGCIAMSGGYCTVCPGCCYWTKHVNQPFWYKIYEEEEVRTSADLKARYDTATQGKSTAEAMIFNMKKELKQVEGIVLSMVSQVRSSLDRLDEIALKPNPLTEVDYIDLLIEGEKQAAKPGWMQRVRGYQAVKEEALIMAQVKQQPLTRGQIRRQSSTPDETVWSRISDWWSSVGK